MRSIATICFSLLAMTAQARAEGGAPVVAGPGLAFGEWGERLELELPPAPRGTRPHVAIVEAHHAVDTEIGSGWRLDLGSSMIRRRSASNGVPDATSDLTKSTFYVDGTKLVTVALPGTAHYEPETYDSSRFDYSAASNTWTRQRDGWTWTYARTRNIDLSATPPACAAPCNTEAWLLSSAVDPIGNRIDYSYASQANPAAVAALFPGLASHEILIDKITYGAATVSFAYEDRPDFRTDWSGGFPLFKNRRLTAITAKVGTSLYSQYALQYVDQGAGSALAAPLSFVGTLTDCDNVAVTKDPAPPQSLLRKVHRVGAGATDPHVVARCNAYYRAPASAIGWASPTRIGGPLTSNGPIAQPAVWTAPIDALKDPVEPVAVDLDGDGRSDLALIVNDGDTPLNEPHRVYISTPNLAQPFAGSSGTGPNARLAASWETRLQAALYKGHFSGKHAHAIIDIDGDGRPELVYENADGVGNGAIEKYAPDTGTFSSLTTTLDGCDVRYGTLVDVDGNGRVDLVVRPHVNDARCPDQATTQWIRNLGAAPWFDSSVRQALAIPLEQATKPASWTTAIAGCGAIQGPTDVDAGWSVANVYLGDQARLADVNGDGVADYAIAVFPCWGVDAATNRWRDGGTAYSRIFYGDGHGNFVDGGISAGMATLLDTADMLTGNTRIVSGTLGTADLDRDGHPELMTSTYGATPFGVAAYSAASCTTGYPWSLADTRGIRMFDTVQTAWPCVPHAIAPAIADFDGDGFADLISVEVNDESGTPTIGSALCGRDLWCVTLRKSNRHVAEGRLVATDNEHGGRTRLTWGFTAQQPNANPELALNLEVLQAVGGPGGTRALTYHGGIELVDRFAGFAEATITNDRGGVEVYSFVQAPYALGAQALGVRYRENGSIEHASVSIHGQYTDGLVVNTSAPYFDPVIRACEYDAGTARIDLDTIEASCLGVAWKLPGFANDDGQAVAITAASYQLVIGHDRYASGRVAMYNKIWGGSARAPAAMASAPGAVSAQIEATRAAVVAVPSKPGAWARWPIPSQLASAIPDIDALEPTPTGTILYFGAPVAYAYDWGYDAAIRKPTARYEHRDLVTTDDDRAIYFSQQAASTTGYWYRPIQELTVDPGGAQLALTMRAFTGFDDPVRLDVCGTDRNACATDFFAYDPVNGTLTSHTFPDSTVERWTRAACGEPLTHTDVTGRVTTDTRDALCLLRSERKAGATTTFTYDALLRPIKRVVDPGGGTNSTLADTFYYDDDLTYQEAVGAREDASYSEPRRAIRRGNGQLDMIFEDGLGREAKRNRCLDSRGNTTGGALSLVACNPLTVRTFAWNLYGKDGLPKVSVEPIEPGATPVTTGFGHDGQDRVIARARPAHTGPGPAWLIDRIGYGAGKTSVTAPTETGTTTRVRSWSTLREATTIDGTTRSTVLFDRVGLSTLVTGPGGVSVLRSYDSQHRLAAESRVDATGALLPVSSVLANGLVTAQTYIHAITSRDPRGRVLEELVPDATYVGTTPMSVRRLGYTYDAEGRLLTRSINGGVVDRIAYTDATTTTLGARTETLESGATSTLRLDGLGRTWTVEAPQVNDRYVYDAVGHVTSATDGNNVVTSYGYDTWGRLATTTDPRRGTTTYSRDAAGHLLATTDGDNVTDSYTYTYSGQLGEHRRGGYLLDSRTYDAQGRLVWERADGVVKLLTYDGLDRLLSVAEGVTLATPLRLTTYEYDAADRVTSIGRWPVAGFATALTSIDYDDWGRPTDVVDPLGHTTQQAFDVADRARRIVDPLSGMLDTTYDDHDRVRTRQRPGAGTERFSYTPNQTYKGRTGLWRIDRRDDQDLASGVTAQRFVDASGSTLAELTAVPASGARTDGTTREWTYSFGRVVEADTRALDGSLYRATSYAYGSDGRLAATTTGPRTDTYGYTPGGRIATVTMPDDQLVRTYSNGLLASEREAGVTRQLTRDSTYGWVIGETRVGTGGTRAVEIARDALGRPIQMAWSDPANPAATQELEIYDYYGHPWLQTNTVGGAAVVEAWSYDVKGRPLHRTINGTALASATTAWSWYDNDVLASVTTPNGTTLSYDYGAPLSAFDYQLDRVLAGTTVVAAVDERDARGAITRLTLPTGVRTTAYDLLGRAVQQVSSTGATTTFSRSASYRPDGDLASETIQGPTGAPWTNTYSYDGAGRLVGETSGPAGTPVSYALDAAGNRLQTLAGGAPVMTATYEGAKLASVDGVALAYDAWNAVKVDHHGNHYARSADGELAVLGTASAATAFARDAAGLPVAALEPGNVTRRTAWDLSAAGLPVEVDQGNGTVLDYVVVEGQHVGTLANGAFTPVDADPRNTTLTQGGQALGYADGSGLGATAPPGTTERFLYGMLETVPSASDVMLARRRTYDPTTARFLEIDPIGHLGGLEVYQYGEGDPINRVDPMGTASTSTGSCPGASPPDLGLSNHLPGFTIDTKGVGTGPSFDDIMAQSFGLGQYLHALHEQASALHIPNPTTPYPEFPGHGGTGTCVVNCEAPSGGTGDTGPGESGTEPADYEVVVIGHRHGLLDWLHLGHGGSRKHGDGDSGDGGGGSGGGGSGRSVWSILRDLFGGRPTYDQSFVDEFVRKQTQARAQEPRTPEMELLYRIPRVGRTGIVIDPVAPRPAYPTQLGADLAGNGYYKLAEIAGMPCFFCHFVKDYDNLDDAEDNLDLEVTDRIGGEMADESFNIVTTLVTTPSGALEPEAPMTRSAGQYTTWRSERVQAEWVTNQSGGRVLVNYGEYNGPDLYPFINQAIQDGEQDIILLSCTHSNQWGEIGTQLPRREPFRNASENEPDFGTADMTEFVGVRSVRVVDATKLTNAKIAHILQNAKCVAPMWCSSGYTRVVRDALPTRPSPAPIEFRRSPTKDSP